MFHLACRSFFLFFGLYGLLRRKNPIVLLVTGLLTFLHPFTAMIFNAALFSAWLHRVTGGHPFFVKETLRWDADFLVFAGDLVHGAGLSREAVRRGGG